MKNIKQLLRSGFRCAVAGILALALLTGFTLLYFNAPPHIPDPDGATDYRWKENAFYSRMTEGFSIGRTNNEGYLNPFDYTEGMNVDVLIMGSSHMEANQVKMHESTAERLSELLPGQTVYNLGMSEHNLLNCIQNTDAALKKYNPSSFLVLETTSLVFSAEDIKKVLDGTFPEIPASSGGVTAHLRKIPFLTLVYSQLRNYLRSRDTNDSKAKDAESIPVLETAALLKYISDACQRTGVTPILVFHQRATLEADGTLSFPVDSATRSTFAALCRENGVVFLDMTDRIEEGYRTDHKLPHGFRNSTVGSGHLNAYGHNMMAQGIYETMQEVNGQ